MTTSPPADQERLRKRKLFIMQNLFSRMPAVNAATRSQGQKLLSAVSNLSSVEWRILWDLHETGPMTVRELTEIQQLDHSLLSRAMPELRRKGYVTVARDPKDGRQGIVSITPQGTEEYARAAPVMARRRAALLEVFDADEIALFIDMMNRLDAFAKAPIEDIVACTEPTE